MPIAIPIPDLPGIVRELLGQIPSGRLTTFGDLAEALGDLSAARWVAEYLAGTEDVPWHRVVKRTGDLASADAARSACQRSRLQAEGVESSSEGKVHLSQYRWHDFQCTAPLRRLADWQDQLAQQANCTADIAVPAVIGGLDVSYASDDRAVAAYVEVDSTTGAVLFSATHCETIRFPYVTGYLTFRERPIHLELLQQVRRQKSLAKVILVDGAGRLHPRRCGIAVGVGVVADCITVGVAKHHLCGRVVSASPDDDPFVEWRGELLGRVLRGMNARHPLYVSPGTGITLDAAVQCVRAVWPSGRSPIPIQVADRLSRSAAKQISEQAAR